MPCEGYGRCWWAQPSASELPDQDALALRQDRCRQLHIRRLMPNVMLQLTRVQTGPNDQTAATSKETNGAAEAAVQTSGWMSPGCNGFPQTSSMLLSSWCCHFTLCRNNYHNAEMLIHYASKNCILHVTKTPSDYDSVSYPPCSRVLQTTVAKTCALLPCIR